VLDLGSGHGLFSLALSMDSDQRVVIGIDHDSKRVHLAKGATEQYASISRPRFEVGDLQKKLAAFARGSLAGIAMIDILHYFDADGQRTLLREAARALEPGGIWQYARSTWGAASRPCGIDCTRMWQPGWALPNPRGATSSSGAPPGGKIYLRVRVFVYAPSRAARSSSPTCSL
jgi:ubiquinone/menaquinone biosynthesis C-methylase UbiE